MVRGGLLVATCLVVLGCESIAGLDDFSDRGSTGGSSAGGSGAAGGDAGSGGVMLASCGEGRFCYPPNPASAVWEGPVAVKWPDEAGGQLCEVWPVDQGAVYADPAVAAGSGTCGTCAGCGSVTSPACGTPQYTVHRQSDCMDPPIGQGPSGASCQPIDMAGGTIAVKPVPLAASGTCAQTAPLVTFTATSAAFAREARLCAPGAPTTDCEGDELCLPDPDADVCIWRVGDHDCHSPYGQKILFAADEGGWKDNRGCTACSCGFDGALCAGNLTVGGNLSCSDSPTSSTPYEDLASCIGANEWMFQSAAVAPNVPPGTCVPMGGEPTGAVEIEDEYTLCCL